MFRPKNGSGDDVFMWRGDVLPSVPTKRADLLVVYITSPKGTTYLASIANPYPAPMYTDTAVFLGENAEAPVDGIFRFKDSVGGELYLICVASFCNDMAQHIGKKMEISYQNQYYYHEGGEAFTERNFVLGYKLLP